MGVEIIQHPFFVETVYITVYCHKLVCIQFHFSTLYDLVFSCLNMTTFFKIRRLLI